MSCGIYAIKNKINSKLYIGSSKNIKNRWKKHKCLLKENKHFSQHLQNSWNNYGGNNFEFIILEECEKERLIEKEQYHLDLYKVYENDKGYNIKTIANSNIGIKFSKDVCKKMSESMKKHYENNPKERERVSKQTSGRNNPFYGKHHSEQIKEKLRLANLGKKQSEETKKKKSEKLKGHFVTKEIRKKISNAHIGKKLSNETKEKLRKIHIGKRHTEQTKIKLSNAFKGRMFTEEHKKKISKALLSENNCQAKLTNKNVIEIKNKYNGGNCSQNKLAKEYNVSQSLISRIINNQRWKISSPHS